MQGRLYTLLAIQVDVRYYFMRCWRRGLTDGSHFVHWLANDVHDTAQALRSYRHLLMYHMQRQCSSLACTCQCHTAVSANGTGAESNFKHEGASLP